MIVRDLPPDVKMDQRIPLPFIESSSPSLPSLAVPAPALMLDPMATPEPSQLVDWTPIISTVKQSGVEAASSIVEVQREVAPRASVEPSLTPGTQDTPPNATNPGSKFSLAERLRGGQGLPSFKVPLNRALDDLADFLAQLFTRIDLPRDGKPPVSVLGESMAEQYEESAGHMSSRVVFTIFLRVGLTRNWKLEYCLPAGSADADARGDGSALDPPWAYTMFRPKDLLRGADSDVILVHGILDTAGRLGQLTLLLPAEWRGRQAFFRALEQWEFRPAAKNGQPVSVEVLLIIPQQPSEE